jgi:hypothetical protein
MHILNRQIFEATWATLGHRLFDTSHERAQESPPRSWESWEAWERRLPRPRRAQDSPPRSGESGGSWERPGRIRLPSQALARGMGGSQISEILKPPCKDTSPCPCLDATVGVRGCPQKAPGGCTPRLRNCLRKLGLPTVKFGNLLVPCGIK